jgi:hypothetical protein
LSAWNLEEAKNYLKEALDARSRILRAQEYGIGDKKTKRAELEQIQNDIFFWKKEVERLEKVKKGKRGLRIGYGVKIG